MYQIQGFIESRLKRITVIEKVLNVILSEVFWGLCDRVCQSC